MLIQEIIKIQIVFLWKGKESKRRINWVSRTIVCKSKSDRGLGIKHCESFSLDLLNKWAWKIIDKHDSPWFQLLSFKYGNTKALMLDPNIHSTTRNSSIWWHDLRSIMTVRGIVDSWF